MKAFFIVGYWNCGTTLLVDVLRKHPEIKLRRARFKPNLEERTIEKLLRKQGYSFIDFDPYYENVLEADGFSYYYEPQLSGEESALFKKRFLRKFGVPEGKWLLLKNPWLWFLPNFLNQQFAEDDVKKLIVLRHGASQVVSKDYWKRGDQDATKLLIARAHFWVKCMEHYFEQWHDQPDMLTIRYENYCQNPEELTRQLCNHLELPFQPIEKHIPPAFENRMKNWQALDQQLQNQVMDIIGPMQERIDQAFPVNQIPTI